MYKYRQLTQEEKIILVQERLAKGYPPHSPPHPVENSEFYLITVTCYEHKCRINSKERRQQLLNQLFEHFTTNQILDYRFPIS
jgi:putative transposase